MPPRILVERQSLGESRKPGDPVFIDPAEDRLMPRDVMEHVPTLEALSSVTVSASSSSAPRSRGRLIRRIRCLLRLIRGLRCLRSEVTGREKKCGKESDRCHAAIRAKVFRRPTRTRDVYESTLP